MTALPLMNRLYPIRQQMILLFPDKPYGGELKPLPNTFVIGSPKCGTTTLCDWLSQHKKIFISKPKEPHYFNDDHGYRLFRDSESYFALFSRATIRHQVIAEGSIWYLFSEVAVDNILAVNPDARFIVMVREPVDMAISLFYQQRRSLFEDLENFKEAWHACEYRRQGRNAPLAPEPRLLDYERVCMQGEHIGRILKKVDRDKVFIGFLDDMRADPEKFLRSVFAFLALEPVPIDFQVLNTGYEIRYYPLHKSLTHIGKWKKRLGIHAGFGLANRLSHWNRKQISRNVETGLRSEMKECFRDDWLAVQNFVYEQQRLISNR